MRQSKIHYQHKGYHYHACGAGDFSTVVKTTDIQQVTCGACLNTKAGKNALDAITTATAKPSVRGRKPSPDAMVKRQKAWSMPQALWDWLEQQPNQSATLRLLIEEASEN